MQNFQQVTMTYRWKRSVLLMLVITLTVIVSDAQSGWNAKRIGSGGMDKMIGELGQGIHLKQQLTEFDTREAGSNQVFKRFCTSRPLFSFQRRKNELIVLDSDVAIFASQEFFGFCRKFSFGTHLEYALSPG